MVPAVTPRSSGANVVSHRARNRRAHARAILAVAVAGLALSPVAAHASTWAPDADGTWSTEANWTGGVPPSASGPLGTSGVVSV